MPDLIRLALVAGAIGSLDVSVARAQEPVPAGADAYGDEDPDLAGELQELEEDASRLQVYGFADFTYTRFLMDHSSPWFDFYFSPYPSFAIGNLNIYLEKQVATRWKSLIEFRLLYLPNGAETVSSSGESERTDTSVLDYQDKTEYLRWGGVSIERAYVEYQAHPLVAIRAGHWLTPFGIWNEDHGSPVLISIRRPFVIGLALLPRSQTGIQLHGSRAVGDSSLGYALTLSNGRGPADTYLDLDNNKGIGGRLVLETRWLDEFKLGVAAYTGTYSARSHSYGLREGEVEAESVLTERYSELGMAADLRARWGPLLVHAELISRQAAFDDDARPPDLVVPDAQQPDYFSYGGYVLAGVRLPWLRLMPYATAEYMRPQWRTVPNMYVGALGVNFPVTPTVTLKTQLQRASIPEARNIIIPEEPVIVWDAQVAWVF
jgi:hypothetical protein